MLSRGSVLRLGHNNELFVLDRGCEWTGRQENVRPNESITEIAGDALSRPDITMDVKAKKR